MAHYDCSNCGEYGGIDFGMCSSCTPKEYHDLINERSDLFSEAADQWDAEHAALRERIKKLNEDFEAARSKGIEAIASPHVKGINDRLHAIQMERHHSYRHRHEREKKA